MKVIEVVCRDTLSRFKIWDLVFLAVHALVEGRQPNLVREIVVFLVLIIGVDYWLETQLFLIGVH